MLHASITIEEPSGRGNTSAVWAWLRDLFRSKEELDALEHAFGQRTLERLGAVGRALESCGVSDVIHLFIDDRPIYEDTSDERDDLSAALTRATQGREVDTHFETLRLVVSAVDDHLHQLIDIQITGRGQGAGPQIKIELAARHQDLRIEVGEQAHTYRDRVLTAVRVAAEPGRGLERFAAHARALHEALTAALPGAHIQSSEAEIRLIRAGTKQVGRLRNLGFERAVRLPTYRSKATHRRTGAYDSPFYYYYFDPYQDLLHWIIVEDMLACGTWTDSRVQVVDRTGAPLFLGSEAHAHRDDNFEVAREALTITPESGLVIDPAIPRVSSMDPVEIGSPHTPGYGGGGDG